MSDRVRFGVYENRSEALRDLIRADLTRAGWESGTPTAATITVVCGLGARDVVLRLADADEVDRPRLLSSMHLRLDAIVRGRGHEVTDLAGRIAGTKGVLSCEVSLASVVDDDATARAPREALPR
jgi:CopG family nickel-responsive transcriptional regulator